MIAGSKKDLVKSFEIQEAPVELRQSWNIAPMTNIPIITEKATDSSVTRRLETARWGLVPV